MAVVEVLFENLNSWLQAQPENTIDTPYEIQINFVNATPSDIGDSRNVGTLGYILKQNSTKYVDLSNSYLGSISGINDISYSFFECTTLVKAPNLWTGLSTMERTFSGCTSLKEAPFVSNATNIEGCFSNCTSLVSAPVIPSNVTNINECFSGCTSLTTWNQLNMLNENISYDKCFKNCLSLININTNVSTELKNWLDAIYAESTDNFPNDPEECNYNDYVEVPVIDLRLVLYKAGLNTVENPYRLKVTGLTADNIKDNIPYGQQTLYGALYYNQKYDSATPSSVYRYVDLRPTVIPETVTDMSSKFISLKNIVYAPDMPITTTLMNGTFYGCSEMLNAPAIPNGVTSIDSCFYNCYNMTETPVIPNSVTSMQQTFYGCSKLTEPANVPVGVTNLWKTFAYNGFTTAPLIPDTVVIMTETFYACRQLSSVILPNKVVLISRCFINTALTETPYLPNTVEQMEESFKNCGSLITVTNLPSNVKNMDGCFSLCSKLTTVPNIPNSVTDFAGTFNNCYHLTECPNIPNKVTDIRGTFRGTGITTPPVIPNGVTNMSSTFESCQSLETAPIIPNGVMYMTGTFCGCTSLTIAPTLPDSVIYMGSNQEYNNNGTFQGCTSLIRVPNVPKNVEDIGNCFNGCTALEEITLFEADLESLIGDASYNNNKAYRCFKNCPSLVKIGLPSEVTESDWHAFRLKFGASTVEGKVYDQTGTAVTIPQTTVTKATLELPIKTDELWFPNGYNDAQIDEIIQKVIQYRYTYLNDNDVLDPAKKNFVLWADDQDNVKTNLVPEIDVSDTVQSGNMNPVTSNAVANYDPVSAKGYMAKKLYTVDATALSTSYFYPVTFAPNDLELDCEIHSENKGGSNPYNQNLIHFLLISQGWSDTPPRFVVLCAGNYDNTEITIGSVWRGDQSGVNCVYVRGGRTYRFVCNRTPVLRTSDYTYGNEVCRVTTDANGNMTNGSRYWSYTQASSYGSYFKDLISGTITNLQNFENNNSSGKNANNVTYNAHTYYTSNGPSTSQGATVNDGALYSQAWSDVWVAQIAQDYRNGALFVRGKNNGTWQPWYGIPKMYVEIFPALLPPNGSNNWIKIGTANSGYGLLPSQSGYAGNGHNYLGTDSWYWKYAYIDQIFCPQVLQIPIGGSHSTNGEIWIE